MKKIAIQGISGCFHDLAAREFFIEEQLEIVECMSFRALCQKLHSGEVDFAMMAIENTIAGSILENYGLLQEYRFKIRGEIILPIQMQLMAMPGTSSEDITSVSSHPMALKQCEEYLSKRPNIKVIPCEDTALAAKKIAENGKAGEAAISNYLSAELYGLEVLDENIHTNTHNYTRFLILSKTIEPNGLESKASICFELGHTPGALAEVLLVFKNNKLNLSKIQSTPILGKPYEYFFHVDVEYDKTEDYKESISQILHLVSNLNILGEYQRGTRVHKQEVTVAL